ncbi:MAG: hypothetical protein AAF589_01220 [Planctomycetota bacterium]
MSYEIAMAHAASPLAARRSAFGCFLSVVVTSLLLLATPALHAQPVASDVSIPQLTDDLRMQLQLSYRGQSTAYEERTGELRQARQAWLDSRQSDADRKVMITWLRAAIRASMPGFERPMPAPPVFAAPPLAKPKPVAQLKPVAEPLPLPTLPAPGSAVTREVKPTTLAKGDEAPAPVTPTPTANEMPKAKPPIVTDTKDEPKRDVGNAIAQPRVAPRSEAKASEMDKAVAAKEIDQGTSQEQTSAAKVISDERQTQPMPLAKHPATAELDWGNPFVDDPLPVDMPDDLAQAIAAARPANPPFDGASPKRRTVGFRPRLPQSPSVRINLSELSARVRGYGQALDVIEAQLIAQPGATGFQLAGMARELEALQAQRELIELYFSILSEIERLAVEDLPSPTPVIDLLAARATNRSETVQKPQSPAASAERAVLDGLRKKLTQLGSENEES